MANHELIGKFHLTYDPFIYLDKSTDVRFLRIHLGVSVHEVADNLLCGKRRDYNASGA